MPMRMNFFISHNRRLPKPLFGIMARSIMVNLHISVSYPFAILDSGGY